VAKKQLKKVKKAAKKIDPLAISLKLLARAGRDSGRAIGFLDKAILESVTGPRFKVCKFQYGTKKYSATLTADQCVSILEVVKQGGDVLGKVQQLLGDLTEAVAECIDILAQSLNITAAAKKKGAAGPAQPLQIIALGCCTYDGGTAANLTKAQCSQYSPTKWDPGNPTCAPTVPPD
jgi:hypothetical protein